jgi:hypothetical protein
MDKLVRNWVIALTVASTTGAVVATAGALMLRRDETLTLQSLSILALGVSFLLLSAWHLAKLLRGSVLYRRFC